MRVLIVIAVSVCLAGCPTCPKLPSLNTSTQDGAVYGKWIGFGYMAEIDPFPVRISFRSEGYHFELFREDGTASMRGNWTTKEVAEGVHILKLGIGCNNVEGLQFISQETFEMRYEIIDGEMTFAETAAFISGVGHPALTSPVFVVNYSGDDPTI